MARPESAKGVVGGVDQAWIARTAALPAAEQVRAVRAELQRRNPDFSGRLTFEVQDNEVAGWTIVGGTLPDLSPLLALSDLKRLDYAALEPERDAPVLREITSLESINDRSAATFRLAFSPNKPKGGVDAEWVESVRALRPEARIEAVMAKLQELNPNFNGEYQFSTDEDRITSLEFHSDAVTDISPLKALPHLQELRLSASGPVGNVNHSWLSDLAPLAGMPLTSLKCGGCRISDLAPLKGLPLTYLNCSGNPISDFSPLQDLPLTSLKCFGTDISDLSQLKGMPLTSLMCGATPVSDLSPLKGMPLTWLSCSYMPVSDLSPLAGMPLIWLSCHHTRVADLSPLGGMPLTHFYCEHTRVSDLSPLEGMKLKELRFDQTSPTNLAIVRGIETLQTINTKPAAEFWREIDAKPAAPAKE